MKAIKPGTNWLIDAGLFTGLIVLFCLDLTGISLHQWLGVGIGVAAGVHLFVHWNWVMSVTGRLFGRTSAQAQDFYRIDLSPLVGFVLILLSGLVISTWFSLPLENYDFWMYLHVIVSVLVLLVVVLKIGLHWQWIVRVAERSHFAPKSRVPAKPVSQPACSSINTGRRQFLSLMGVVSVAALISLSNVWDLEQKTVASASSGDQGSSTTQQSASASGNSSQCIVQCNRRCSYPGQCRRYTDANSNNRCDFGECV